jgi:hypothetical protein
VPRAPRSSRTSRVTPDAQVTPSAPTPEEATPLAQPATPAPTPDDAQPIELTARRASRKIAASKPAEDDADAALAAAAKAAAKPEPAPAPVERWQAAISKLRVAGEPLSLVRHLITKPLVGSFATAACGYTYMVDPKAPLTADEVDLERCGWCVRTTRNELIPPYNRGQRRPALPDDNLAAVRQRTPEPPKPELAPEVAALLDDGAFMAAMSEVQSAVQRMISGEWTPDPEEMARLQTLTANTKAATEIRNSGGATPTTAPTASRSRSEAASQPRGPRGPLVRDGKWKTVEGETDELLDIRVGNSKATTLVRTRDPIGPYLLGYRSANGSRWIARDVRVPNGQDPDTEFGADKAAALAFVRTETAKLSAEEAAQWAAVARSRMKRNDPINRRSR